MPSQVRSQRMVEILSKLEYMPGLGEECGPEETTLEERLKWWIHTILRPQALLLLGMGLCFCMSILCCLFFSM